MTNNGLLCKLKGFSQIVLRKSTSYYRVAVASGKSQMARRSSPSKMGAVELKGGGGGCVKWLCVQLHAQVSNFFLNTCDVMLFNTMA